MWRRFEQRPGNVAEGDTAVHAFPAIDPARPVHSNQGAFLHVTRHCLQRPSELGMPHEVPNLHGIQPDVLPVMLLIWVRKGPCINHHHLVTARGMSRCVNPMELVLSN